MLTMTFPASPAGNLTYSRAQTERLRKPEAQQDELTERLTTVPADISDMRPNVTGT